MAWFADIIQNPVEKKAVSLVVKGGKGCGKSVIFEELLFKIFGYTYIKIDKTDQITGKFNQHLHGKLLLVLEEAIWAGDKNAEGTLKSMIADTQFMVEGKGTNAEKSEGYFRFAFVSNEKQSVPATRDERRYFAIKVSDEYCGNIEYFTELVHEIRNGGVESFMYYLEHLDISKVYIRTPPQTEALFEDILAKMETIERFLYDLLHVYTVDLNYHEGYISLWGEKVTKCSLFKYFQEWESSIRSKNIYLSKHDITTQTKFVREINNIMDFKNIKIKTENGYELPPRDVARKMFESKVKSKVIWNDDISDTMIDIDYEVMSKEMDELVDDDMRKRKIELENEREYDKMFKTS
jgi:hypothetical protein